MNLWLIHLSIFKYDYLLFKNIMYYYIIILKRRNTPNLLMTRRVVIRAKLNYVHEYI